MVVVAQKVVSKAEGRVVRLDELEPSDQARELAADDDPRKLEAILREADAIVRARPPLVIARTRHGFVCGSAGVDASNAPEPGTLVLLPLDPDASAARIRGRLRELTGKDVGVIVSDSFGRPFRMGTTDVAIGAAGLRVLDDLRGTRDRSGYELRSTQIAVADELAGAAQLVMGKADGIPAAVVRGLDLAGDGERARARHPARPRPLPLSADSRIAAASASVASSAAESGSSSSTRCSSRRVRPRCSRRRPFAVAVIRTARLSAGCGVRRTSPSASRPATRPLIVGQPHLLRGGELARRPRAAEDEHRQEREPGRGEAGLDVRRPHAPEQMDRGRMQPVGRVGQPCSAPHT